MIHGELFQELQRHRLKKWYLKGQSIFSQLKKYVVQL
jgi:hypothetical protein